MIKLYQAANGMLRAYIPSSASNYWIITFAPTYSIVGSTDRNYFDNFCKENTPTVGSWDNVRKAARRDAIRKIFEK